ncbi:hypothetical protein Esti_000049 [Eimeria stiedai]
MASGASGLLESPATPAHEPQTAAASEGASSVQPSTPVDASWAESSSPSGPREPDGNGRLRSEDGGAQSFSATLGAEMQGGNTANAQCSDLSRDCSPAAAPCEEGETAQVTPGPSDSTVEVRGHPTCSAERASARRVKPDPDGEGNSATPGGEAAAQGELAEESRPGKQAEQIDVASLFLSPFEDLDSWATDDHDLVLPAASFVNADAISQHLGPMTLGRVALFLFGLFQGDVRMGILSAQGRLLAWRCLLHLAEQHDRQTAGVQSQQPSSAQPAGVTAVDPGLRRRRLQRESVATSKGRRSVRHAFLLDRNSGASRGAAGGAPGNASSFSPGANDEWADAEEEAAPSAGLREDAPGEVAKEQALATPSMSAAMTLQKQLQQGLQTIGFEPNFTRFIGGTIDRRWALQQRSLRIPAETLKGEAPAGKGEPLELRLEEYGSGTAPKMWPRIEALPEQLFVGLPIQVACWIGWGRQDGADAGRMLWRDCEVVQLLAGGIFKAMCFGAAGDSRPLTCRIRDFIPPRLPVPSPKENAWRLMPTEADPSRDIYPGACLSVGLSASHNTSTQDQQQPEVAKAYFVDVVVQDVYFTLEQTTRARQALAVARERDEAGGARGANSSRRIPGCVDTGGPVEGLRPNCPVRAVRVMVLRSGGAAKEFALVSGRMIYKLGYDLYTLPTGFFKETASAKQRQAGSRFAWAIPRALSPVALGRVKATSATAATAAAVSSGEVSGKRWQYRTQEDSREWISFPPFLVAYIPYDCTARYTETHPLLLRYLQPELDLASLSRGVWSLCMPQYEHPSLPPAVLAHPSDLPQQGDKPALTAGEAGASSATGVTFLESPYTHSNGGLGGGFEGRNSANHEEVGDALCSVHANEPPQPVVNNQTGAETSAASSILSINHLASLLCSAGDAAPSKDVLSKALPFFRGLLPHLGQQVADTWQVKIARAAMRAADQAKELYIDEQETEVERLRRQGISFGELLRGSAAADSGRDQLAKEQAGESMDLEGGEAWEWLGNSASRYPTSSDISRFLLRTSGQNAGGLTTAKGRGVEGHPSHNDSVSTAAGAGRRRTFEAAAGLQPRESRRGSASEFGVSDGRGRAEDAGFCTRGAAGGESDLYISHRVGAVSSSGRVLSDEAVSGASRPRAGPAHGAASGFGASPATARRKALVQREDEEDFQPSARAAAGSRHAPAGGRVGMARRAARNVSYTALAGIEAGPEDSAFYRPTKRVARSESHALSREPVVVDPRDHLHAKTAGSEPAASETDTRVSSQQWAALQRQATAAEERLLNTQGTRVSADRPSETSISADQLQEALKGFVQSVKAGASPAVVPVPSLARNRSFAASH